jgi:heterodisulfide reductase subunit A
VEPKDIPETVMQASGAAGKAMSFLAEQKGALVRKKEYPPEIDVKGQEPRIGVFVCHCGKNIGGVIPSKQVAEYAAGLANVVYATDKLYTCSQDSIQSIKQAISEHKLNRVVVAACSPRTHEPLFRDVLREAGLNPYLFEMTNIRDQCTWVHMQEPEKAFQKAKDLVRMAVARARLLEPLYKRDLEIIHKALVIGGGLAGMTSALELANQGFETYLIEKEKQLGGNLRKVRYLLEGEQVEPKLQRLIMMVSNHPKIQLFLNTQVKAINGSLGNFKTIISQDGKEKELEHGVVIVAVGAEEYKPKEYLYGQDNRVITQLELESRLAQGAVSAKSVVMIQCVGSRDEERTYCSRICCSEAVKNALKIKELSPQTSVYILYRDMRTYGFREKYYRKAREQGVVFIRYEPEKKPQVEKNNGQIQVKVFDLLLGKEITLKPDLLVLSAGVVSRKEDKLVAQMLKVPQTQDGFFLEAHMKLRPVDFSTDGVFLAGLAHASKDVDETISQACAASARASTILSKPVIELEATISQPVDANCDGCAYCVDPCPYKAISLIEYAYQDAVKKTVEVNSSLCKGCGVCQATCPKKGIFVNHFKLEQIMAQINAALEVQNV